MNVLFNLTFFLLHFFLFCFVDVVLIGLQPLIVLQTFTNTLATKLTHLQMSMVINIFKHLTFPMHCIALNIQRTINFRLCLLMVAVYSIPNRLENKEKKISFHRLQYRSEEILLGKGVGGAVKKCRHLELGMQTFYHKYIVKLVPMGKPHISLQMESLHENVLTALEYHYHRCYRCHSVRMCVCLLGSICSLKEHKTAIESRILTR